MAKLIKMDLYRLFKTKSFKILLLVSLSIAFIAVAVISGIAKLIPMLPEESQLSFALTFPFASWIENVSVFSVMYTSFYVLSLMVISIATAIFISSEHSSGYIKNIAGQVKNKGMLVVAKFATLAIATGTIFVSYLAGAFASAQIFLHGSLNYAGFMDFAAVIGVKYLLFLAVVAIIIFLCTLTKSSSLAIAFGVIFGTGMTTIVYTAVSFFLETVTKHSIQIASFTPDGFAFKLAMATSPEILAKGCVLSVIYIAVFLILSTVVMNKRDTR